MSPFKCASSRKNQDHSGIDTEVLTAGYIWWTKDNLFLQTQNNRCFNTAKIDIGMIHNVYGIDTTQLLVKINTYTVGQYTLVFDDRIGFFSFLLMLEKSNGQDEKSSFSLSGKDIVNADLLRGVNGQTKSYYIYVDFEGSKIEPDEFTHKLEEFNTDWGLSLQVESVFSTKMKVRINDPAFLRQRFPLSMICS